MEILLVILLTMHWLILWLPLVPNVIGGKNISLEDPPIGMVDRSSSCWAGRTTSQDSPKVYRLLWDNTACGSCCASAASRLRRGSPKRC